MDDLTIELKDGYNTLKDIYYQSGQGSVFTYSRTRNPMIVSSLFIMLSVAFYFIALLYPEMGWIFLMALCSLISFFRIIFTVVQCKKYFSWKNPIDKYLNEVRKYETHSLTLSARSFILINSNETIIEKWESIQYVSINRDYISVRSSNHSFILPEKSMLPDQYMEVRSFIKQRMSEDPSKVLVADKE
jgi:hypothetical protein